MPVIAIVNQKGGTGKTTLSTNLAWAFSENARVLLLDADPQGSAQDWADSRRQPLLSLAVQRAEPGRLIQTVRSLASEYDWVIIDGPPGITRTSADAVRAADLVLVPAKASPFDVWRVGGLGHRDGSEGAAGGHRGDAQSGLRHHHDPAPHAPEPAD